jgi:hypothetical protein
MALFRDRRDAGEKLADWALERADEVTRILASWGSSRAAAERAP